MSHHFIDLEIEHETLVLLNEKIAHRNNIECVQCNFLLSVSFLRMLAMSVKIYFEYALSKKTNVDYIFLSVICIVNVCGRYLNISCEKIEVVITLKAIK